jgi:hypothetical protein
MAEDNAEDRARIAGHIGAVDRVYGRLTRLTLSMISCNTRDSRFGGAMRSFVYAAFVLAGATGCASTMQVGNYHVRRETWERDQSEIGQRAAFETKCSADQLTISILAAETYYGMFWTKYDQPKQVGVTGCGHRLVYARTYNPDSSWILNSTTAKEQ